MLVQLVSPLVEGWPLPRSGSVVYHSPCKAPAAFRGGPSLWWGLELSVVAMQTRTPVLIGQKREKGYLQSKSETMTCFHTSFQIKSLTTELLTLLSQFA